MRRVPFEVAHQSAPPTVSRKP